jgi:hypothetical protein
MSRPTKIATGTEAQMTALQATIDKALGYPRRGINIGDSPFAPVIPETWDGTGDVPVGWTETATSPWLDGATAVLPLPDDLAAELQAAPAQARISPAERAAIIAAISSRSSAVLDDFTPKERQNRRSNK